MEQNKENLEKYAYFLRMLNQTNLEAIQKIENSFLSLFLNNRKDK